MPMKPPLSQAELDEEVQACYRIDRAGEAVDCLKGVIEAVPEKPASALCPPRLVLFTKSGCPFCDEEKEHRHEDLLSGAIIEIDIESPAGAAIAEKNEINFAPALVLLDCNDILIELEPTEEAKTSTEAEVPHHQVRA